MFEAERRLQQNLHSQAGIDIQVVGLRDAHSEADRAAWSPLDPLTLPVAGPKAFGYSRAFADTLIRSEADLAYLAGLWKYPALATLRWHRRTSRPLIVAPHGMLDPWALCHVGMRKKIVSWLFQDALLQKAACLRALCRAEADSLRSYGLKNPICVIPNGIDLPRPGEDAVPRPSFFPSEKRILLYLGRIHPKKGLKNLLSAWNAVRPQSSNWVLALAGWDQGDHEAQLKRHATGLRIAWQDAARASAKQSLLFLGPQFGDAKLACYRHCDAFVLPSLSEGLPMVVLEAWANSKPVLMTPPCNLPEGFSAQAAIRMEPTTESIIPALEHLLTMSAADLCEMGLRGRALAEQRFSWPEITAQTASVFNWILKNGSRPDCVDIP